SLPAGELPHRDVHALFAERSVAGITVVLYGRDARGKARVAWLNTDATSHTVFRHRLHLVADKLLGARTPALVGFFGFRPTPRPRSDHLVVAIAPPGTTALEWRGDGSRWPAIPSTDGAGLPSEPT